MQNSIKVGVGLYILSADNKLLLGLRKSKHGTGTWSPSGGKLEFGEEFEDAAIRETKEETSLDIKKQDITIAAVTSDIHEQENEHVITIHTVTKKYSGELKLMEPDKFEKWEWFSLQNLPENLFLPVAKFIKENGLDKFIKPS
ncbi:MAG: NUDIX domain-containing protein [Lactobacillaceae bacterium]|jgi:ADP-ribose pyrophosphatase YjhB (NUDIX family)|nr:NUDIX domain-containing protein [Lactobacillaceae bacterium]